MNKSILYILKVSFLCCVMFSFNTVAADWVRCEPQKISGVRIKLNGDVSYNVKGNGNSRRLAFKGASDINGRNQIITQMLLKAIEKDYYIQALYPKGYNCKKGDFETEALWIVVDNPKW